MAKIFISYAQDGHEIAEELRASLERAGVHKVFIYSSDDLQVEKNAEAAIKACDLFVTLVTANSHDSKLAYTYFKLAEASKKAIFPITVDSGLPPHLRAYDAIELKGLDTTPIGREIELTVLRSERKNEQRSLRAVMVAIALIAIVLISYNFLFPEVQAWYILNFVPSPTATPTNTPMPTHTPVPSRTPIPTATPIPSFSPVAGGGELVFTRFMDADATNVDIFLLDLATGQETQLTDNSAIDSSPAWSPDGSQILFSSARDGDIELYLMNADGSDVRQLTDNDVDDYHPSWSPDASRIVFISERNGVADIFVMDANGEHEEQLTDTFEEELRPAWSPGGSQIAFTAERDFTSSLYLINPDGENESRLTEGSIHVNAGAAWSPDGSQIVFIVDSLQGGREVYTMNADGSNRERLTEIDNSSVYYPSWSPDGSQIIFTQLHLQSDGSNPGDIYIMNADGSDMRRITNTPEDEYYVRWRPESPE